MRLLCRLIGRTVAAILIRMWGERSRRERTVYGGGVLLSAVLAGCSLLLPIEDYTDGGGMAPDASPDPPDDASPDPSDGAGLVDADAPGDASGDSAPSSCPPSAFCVDFETRQLEAFLEQRNDNGTIRIDSTVSRSPPNSLLATSNGSGVGDSHVFARTTFSGTPQIASLTAQVRVDQFAADGTTGVLRLGFGSGGYIELIVGSDGDLDFFASSTNTAISTGARLLLDTWARFTLRVDFSQTPARATLFRFGATTVEFPSDAPVITVGLSYTDERGWIVRYDDVVFETQ